MYFAVTFSINTLSNLQPFVNKNPWINRYIFIDNRSVSLYYLNRRVILIFTTYIMSTQTRRHKKGKCLQWLNLITVIPVL